MTIVVILRLLVELAMPMTPPPGRVSAQVPATAVPGMAVELSVTILDTPAAGAPINVWLTSPGVELVPNRFDSRDVVDPQATQPRIRVRVIAPAAPGRYAIDAHVLYVSCGESTCRPHLATVHWDLEVAAPAAAGAPHDR